MGQQKDGQIIVLGQGIAGLTAAVVLGEAGYPVQVLGRRYPAAGGLQLSPNGFKALAVLGLDEAVLNKAVRLNSVVIKSLSANRHLTEIIHKPDQTHAAIARQDVLDLLTDRAERLPQVIFTDTDLHALHFSQGKARIVSKDGQLFAGDEVIGADGATGLARAAIAGSVNWARKDSMDAAVVNVDNPSRISTRMVSRPAFESQKAVATPMIPPPITTTSAVRSAVSGT